MASVGVLIGLHAVLVVAMRWTGGNWLPKAGLLQGEVIRQPWRLLSSLVVHVDLPHVLWNGASMMVFAVPLLTDLRLARTGLVYVVAGVGGGLAASWLAPRGTLVVGSSGAVAGLFGAWVVWTLHRARFEVLGRRARVRAMGIGLLVLPSLLTPVTATGKPISVSSHLGGLLTGLALGALISRRWVGGPSGALDEEPGTGGDTPGESL